ncbi:hypothetical protein AKJ09_04960 [Labilithrix luteola]|uniref:Uncharacterized protein n=1 Tax=Labilithrix luteola TaxID=1391654 RepID=A0A0K1PY49_9BACT|nr:hypothetical protein [Labilithrix luteola]AKU98296.1 hypothetical protein AKJ09_04960 [Labilithrix luteola]
MSFNGSYRRVMEGASTSHVWIHLHRLVEAYARTTGTPFPEVFDDLERRFDFLRGERARWPDLATMRRAAGWLRTSRSRILDERQSLVRERRDAKRRGDRGRVPVRLREHEGRTRMYVERVPRVGYWGWRARRHGPQ